jgi:hypothetical protein
LPDDVSEIGDRDLRVDQVGVPDLLPFEAVVAFVGYRLQSLDLTLDGNISGAGKDILAVLTLTD